MKRTLWTAVSGLLLSVALVVVAFPAGAGAADRFSEQISLPKGWEPEGIVTGKGPVLYAGSLAELGIYEVDLRTGEGQVLTDAERHGHRREFRRADDAGAFRQPPVRRQCALWH